MISVAIDGPAGAGKSTIAKNVAQRLSFVYVDTGALYRTIAFYFLQNHVDADDYKQVCKKISDVKIKIKIEDGSQKIELFGKDVSELIRSSEISMTASKIAAIDKVREFLIDFQRESAAENNVVMDGRDIGTVVLPSADVKIFLTASCEERARRRYEEFEQKNIKITYEEVLKQVKERDKNDTERKIAPLKKADDAVTVDSSNMTVQEVTEFIVDVIEKRTADENKNE